MKNRLPLLLHPIYIVSIMLLFVNDHFLKEMFGNFFTGKLSDFAGIFAFYVFVYVISGRKNFTAIFIVLFFIFFKSPYSQSSIEWYNTFSPIDISRVVDYTDLWAFVMLIPAYLFVQTKKNIKINIISIPKNISAFGILIVSSVVFMATSQPPNTKYNSVSVKLSVQEIKNLLDKNNIEYKYGKIYDTLKANEKNYTLINKETHLYKRQLDTAYIVEFEGFKIKNFEVMDTVFDINLAKIPREDNKRTYWVLINGNRNVSNYISRIDIKELYKWYKKNYNVKNISPKSFMYSRYNDFLKNKDTLSIKNTIEDSLLSLEFKYRYNRMPKLNETFRMNYYNSTIYGY